ncbi:MAG: DUF494 domain-containing protein [Gallionellaceae bacterium]
MFDILMFLFESYFHAGSYPDSEKLSLKLSAVGFEEEEIRHALTWLTDLKQLTHADYPAVINNSGARCFADLELQRISPEAFRFIAFWEQSRMITPVEREMILDRSVALHQDNLPLNQVKLITLMVLWNQHEDLDPLIVEDLFTFDNSEYLH